MKKQFVLLFCFCMVSFQMIGQEASLSTFAKAKNGLGKAFQHVTISTSMGSGTLNPSALQTTSFKSLLNVSLGDIQVNYKLNSRFSLGLATSSSFGTCNEGYTTAEGLFMPYQTYSSGLELELDDFELFDFNDDNDGDHHNDNGDHNDHSDDDDDSTSCGENGFGQNILGSFQFQFSKKVPVFVRVNAGYSMANRAPIYSAFVGYHQKIFKGLGLVAGFQFSDILRLNTPVGAVSHVSPPGLKAQMGLSWNF